MAGEGLALALFRARRASSADAVLADERLGLAVVAAGESEPVAVQAERIEDDVQDAAGDRADDLLAAAHLLGPHLQRRAFDGDGARRHEVDLERLLARPAAEG